MSAGPYHDAELGPVRHRHVVYRPARLTPDALESGYHWAYREFYRWSSIARASWAHDSWKHSAKHFAYSAGWKKFERAWNLVIRMRQLRQMTPLLEAVLSKVTRATGASPSAAAGRLPGPQAGRSRRRAAVLRV
jgi:hypothetical protein